jgi:membrane-associated protein
MLDYLREGLSCLMQFDTCLQSLIIQYDVWVYLILFCIIFAETGLVVTPFLPGDSLLFATGLLAGQPGNPLSIQLIAPLLLAAAFLGDNSNYFIGRFVGKKVYEKDYRLIKRKYLIKTHDFYEKHGGQTIIYAKFMPIVRTFAPFVAGVGSMTYRKFLTFGIIGNLIWVNLFLLGGFFANQVPIIRDNFETAIIIILAGSLVPPIYHALKSQYKKFRNRNKPSTANQETSAK